MAGFHMPDRDSGLERRRKGNATFLHHPQEIAQPNG
jgi:hypothetical protein